MKHINTVTAIRTVMVVTSVVKASDITHKWLVTLTTTNVRKKTSYVPL